MAARNIRELLETHPTRREVPDSGRLDVVTPQVIHHEMPSFAMADVFRTELRVFSEFSVSRHLRESARFDMYKEAKRLSERRVLRFLYEDVADLARDAKAAIYSGDAERALDVLKELTDIVGH